METIKSSKPQPRASEDSSVDKLLLIGSKLRLDVDDLEQLALHIRKVDDWQLFLNRAAGTHLAPILATTFSYKNFKEGVPVLVLEELQRSQQHVMASTIVLQEEFKRFATIMAENDLAVVPLKGIYLTEKVYQNVSFRHLSDIDVLVREKDLKRICSLMEERGFESKRTILRSSVENEHFAHAHPITLEKGSIRIELHTNLYNQSQGIKIDPNELWEDTQPEILFELPVFQFSEEMFFQHLCLHLHKHLFGHELKLVSFCDLREFLRVNEHTFSWSRFGAICKKYACEEAINEVLYITHWFWGVTEIPLGFRTPNRPTAELEERFWGFFHGSAYESTKRLENRIDMIWTKWSRLNALDRLRYVSGQLFPSEEFMRKRYGLTDEWILPWYVYRPIEQSAKAIKAMVSKSFRN